MAVIVKPDNSIPGETTRVAALLIAAADNPADVKTDTMSDNGLVFVVPDEVAAKVDLNPPKPKEAEVEKKPSKPAKGDDKKRKAA